MGNKRLIRNHKGIEGYFYRVGNCKLAVEPGLIREARYQHEPSIGNTALVIQGVRATGIPFLFYMAYKEEYESLLHDFGVKNVEELGALPTERRMILVYNHQGIDAGISVCGSNQSCGRLRI